VLSGLVLIVRAVIGPFHFLASVQSPVNAESVFGAALVACLALRASRGAPSREKARGEPVWLVAAVALALAGFARSLSFDFVSDDFALLHHARSATAAHLIPIFTRSGDGFFRPLGHVTLWMLWPWAGVNPVGWHVASLAVHAGTCILVFLFVRRLYPYSRIPGWAAALFAVHGSHPETVNWMASWFGGLAAFFTMAALLLFLHYRRRPRAATLAGSLACLVAALLSKESSFVFPALAFLAAGRPWRAALRMTLPYWIMTGAVWSYRAWVVGGVGGYKVAGSNAPQVFHLSLLGIAKALGLRLWSTLMFPVNWSVEPEPYLVIALIAAVAALLALAGARPDPSELIVPLGFILVSALPVIHLLLIGADLLNARSVYLSSIGFSMLLAVAVESVDGVRLRPWIGGALVLFQFAALQHNLSIRRDVASLARRACQAASQSVAAGETISVAGLPAILQGIHFWANGFPECVEISTGKPGRILDDAAMVALVWDGDERKLKRRGSDVP
jgi:hypothetical protein